MAKEKSEKPPKEELITPANQALSYLKNSKGEHTNFRKSVNYSVSTGSLKMDIAMGGGIKPGLIRLVGITTGGKTSEGLELMKNFLAERHEDGMALYVKAEGRLSDEVIDRSGVNFIRTECEDDVSKWKVGTCLVWESNIFENVSDFIKDLVQNNPTKRVYFFLVDSMDGLILRADKAKTSEESFKVAGPAVLGKKFAQHLMNEIVKSGHFFAFTSQVTAQPKIDTYAPADYRLVSGTGGNWAVHYPDNIWEFKPRYQKHQILKDPKAKKSETNPIVGHIVEIVIKKSSNEKYETVIQYPVCYGRKGGTSIWVEREIAELLISWGFVQKSGSWFNFSENLLARIKDINLDNVIKVQGMDQLYEFIGKYPVIRDDLYQMFKETLTIDAVASQDDPLEEEKED